MKFNTQGITRSIGRKVLLTKKNSPHIFFVGGVVGVVGSAVLACRATLKLEDKLDEIASDLEALKALNEGKLNGKDASFKHTGYVIVKSAGTIGKLYGPSLVLGTVSIAALTGSHIQLTRRNAALSATLAVVSKAYDEYRIRVQDELGKAKELEIHRDITDKQVEIDGKSKKIKVVGAHCSPYARFFDEGCRNWVNNAEENQMFLQCQQNYMNHMLNARGHVFLNDVYDALGLERSSAGQIVGWIKNSDGDGYVDFGLFEFGNVVGNRLDRCVLLDFNVDGPIYELI